MTKAVMMWRGFELGHASEPRRGEPEPCPDETEVGLRGDGADIVGCEPGPAVIGGRGDASDVHGQRGPVEADRGFVSRPADEVAGDVHVYVDGKLVAGADGRPVPRGQLASERLSLVTRVSRTGQVHVRLAGRVAAERNEWAMAGWVWRTSAADVWGRSTATPRAKVYAWRLARKSDKPGHVIAIRPRADDARPLRGDAVRWLALAWAQAYIARRGGQ